MKFEKKKLEIFYIHMWMQSFILNNVSNHMEKLNIKSNEEKFLCNLGYCKAYIIFNK